MRKKIVWGFHLPNYLGLMANHHKLLSTIIVRIWSHPSFRHGITKIYSVPWWKMRFFYILPVMVELCKHKSDTNAFKEIWFGARLLWVRSTVGNINLYWQCPSNLLSESQSHADIILIFFFVLIIRLQFTGCLWTVGCIFWIWTTRTKIPNIS